MAAMTQAQMLTEVDTYLRKLEALFASSASQFKYITGTVPANSSTVYDAPTELGFTATTHSVYSLGVELRMVDPFTTPNPPVIQATAVLDYVIAADGKVTFRNNHNADVVYHARITEPVKK